MELTAALKKEFMKFQRNEITEYHIYSLLAANTSCPNNRKILYRIAEDERRHYYQWKEVTGQEVLPHRFRLWKYYLIARVFGLTFGIKLMEAAEKDITTVYGSYEKHYAPAGQLAAEEDEHERTLINMIDEEHLKYTGSIVLGLNDALVELTGALAGFTLALQNTKLIALTGTITGIAAAFSMAASEYLSTKSEETDKNPVKSAVYTGAAYIVTVLLLISPYLFLKNYFVCLAITLSLGVIIIASFNYYISVAKDLNFKRRFLEMTCLSLGIAAISFLIGWLLRTFTGIEI
ncbi:MAG: VIT1/CCC1 transporter family protein [Kiritimatiellales bacterium]